MDPAPEFRNPFRFGAVTSPPPSAPPMAPPVTGGAAPGGPVPAPPRAAPPPAPPAGRPLVFMGFVESPGITGRVVVLTDGETVFYGREGEVVDGRYRIVALGRETVDIERIDGQGRQTLRLPGE